MTISIIIPAYNEAGYISNTLERIITIMESTSLSKDDWEIIQCNFLIAIMKIDAPYL